MDDREWKTVVQIVAVKTQSTFHLSRINSNLAVVCSSVDRVLLLLPMIPSLPTIVSMLAGFVSGEGFELAWSNILIEFGFRSLVETWN
ncbi:unnamed protein product [Lactuca virosa]|uniref:Solute carrier family 40 protein n=1 Tax=Lactuca virosa TaxID=75947 RepID=A0AAU9N2N5_9ASTR|nr:unnamed protein product [Lactuca virosa]